MEPETHAPLSRQCPAYKVEGSGPLLLFVAGIDGTGELFFKQAAHLACSFRVVSFRLREGSGFTYDDLADDCAAIVRDLGERQATVVAESFGGAVAFSFALRYPEMVERLVIINSFARFPNRLLIKAAARIAPRVPLRLMWYLRKTANTLGLLVDGVKREDRRRFFEVIRTVNREGYARRLRLIAELDLEERLAEIKAPTLFIAGDKDLLIRSVKEAQLMAARMPNASIKVMAGAGHACLLGDRVRLADLLK
ncbi:MAG TPA: alpha/beta hydrolase [Blastocatellia bacterium]|nr:alpha/beta hydrolase [Blastocatellia bacterium]